VCGGPQENNVKESTVSEPKVAHVATVDLALRYLLLGQMQSLQQAGYDVVGISSPGTEIDAVEAVGLRHVAVPISRRFTPLADLVSLWRLFRVMSRERFTIVHCHNPKPGLLGQLAARLARVPVVVNTLHGFYFHEHMKPWRRRFYITMEKIAARCSDVILSQNQEDMHTAVRERICTQAKIKFLGNGIDVRHFDRARIDPQELAAKRADLGLPSSALVVGFVGRLVREKGVLELLQAAREIIRRVPRARFLFVGPLDFERPDALKADIALAHGIADHCVFTGLRNDMPALYALMDVFVLPSHREGFPRSALEASSMSVPCVVTDVRGCREAVEHRENGLLVPRGDVRALSEAILEILTDRDKARQMGARGRQMALERFDELLVFDKVRTEYARLLARKGLSQPGLAPSSSVND
jgi:glycosyltransferase involved in cell wall biosynthesis